MNEKLRSQDRYAYGSHQLHRYLTGQDDTGQAIFFPEMEGLHVQKACVDKWYWGPGAWVAQISNQRPGLKRSHQGPYPVIHGTILPNHTCSFPSWVLCLADDVHIHSTGPGILNSYWLIHGERPQLRKPWALSTNEHPACPLRSGNGFNFLMFSRYKASGRFLYCHVSPIYKIVDMIITLLRSLKKENSQQKALVLFVILHDLVHNHRNPVVKPRLAG